jgi:hypothetical protein
MAVQFLTEYVVSAMLIDDTKVYRVSALNGSIYFTSADLVKVLSFIENRFTDAAE